MADAGLEFSTSSTENEDRRTQICLAAGQRVIETSQVLVRLGEQLSRAAKQAQQAIARESMPSSWPVGSVLVPNNNPVLRGSFRAAGIADPAYGGGSMIIQATGSLVLDGGTSHDFVFPGGLVLKAGVSIDYNGTAVVTGWTTNGQAWQGQYHEAPVIMSSAPPIDVWLSDLNWANFNVRPIAGVRAFQLRRQPNGSAQYATSDTTAPHLNTYSTLVNAAANGECWICLVDSTPVDMTQP